MYDLIKINQFPEMTAVPEGSSWFVVAGADGLGHKISDLNLKQFLLGSGAGARIIDPGVLAINSSTSATLTGAVWVHTGGIYEFTGDLTIPGSPIEPNNRFDIVTFGDSDTPVVKAGDALPEPNVPNPDTGFLLGHIIYRPYGGGGIVTPVNPNTYSTAVTIGAQGEYAPIWQMDLSVNTYYGFKISFLSWSSSYDQYGQYPTNGILMVNFVTGGSNAQIDPNRVAIRSMDMGVDNGDFMLVQTGTSQATLYTKKKSYLGNMSFNWVSPVTQTVSLNSLVNGGVYGSLPGGDAYPSYNGRDYVSSTMPIRFDLPRQYGFDTPVSDHITFPADLGDAIPPNPTRADTNVMVKVLHRRNVNAPNITAPSTVWLRCEGGNYVTGTDNILYFIAHKENGVVVGISYTITQDMSI